MGKGPKFLFFLISTYLFFHFLEFSASSHHKNETKVHHSESGSSSKYSVSFFKTITSINY